MRPINRLLLGLPKRAERATSAQLVSSFVDVGSLLSSVTNNDHQIIYGRRGTGKTHVLAKLAADALASGDIPIRVDLRTLGSTGGIYSDTSVPLPERATRLLVDLLWAVYNAILEHVIEHGSFDLVALQPRLDDLAESISKVRVVGEVTQASSIAANSVAGSSLALEFNGLGPAVAASSRSGRSLGVSTSQVTTGAPYHQVNFGDVAGRLLQLAQQLGQHRVWLLLDEWSEIPVDLQPYLADLLRRSIFPVAEFVTKIAAIEQRTNFRIANGGGGYIGIEIGADAAASLTLDDFMVFDNNAGAATSFFRSLLWKHVTSLTDDVDLRKLTEQEFVSEAFTQVNSIQELARAAEGVPRDAINIAAIAAQRAIDHAIAVAEIRSAARQWYQQSKEGAVASRESALSLLQWIRSEVIGSRRARAFLLPTSTRDELIDYLYDQRVLHIIKRGVSSNDTPGVRYNVYAIDYGCYVDLTSTSSAPRGLFEADVDGSTGYVDVPATDYRSIRRAILDLPKFYQTAERVEQA